MNDMYLDYRRKSRRRKKGPVILLLILIAVAIGIGGYYIIKNFVINDNEDYNEAEDFNDGLSASWLAYDVSASETSAPGTDTANPSSDNSAGNLGIYGLWTDTKPKEETKKPEDEFDDEEKWMPDFVDTRKRVDVKGIYISSAYMIARMDDALKLVDRTELNAVVLDVKSDSGYITYKMDYDVAKEIGATTANIADINKLITDLHNRGIYVIARVVSLKDPILAEKKPELALKKNDGSIFRDSSGLAWVNPYEDGVWEYLTEVCRQCVLSGFDEVNLDYIRFSTDSGMKEVDFGPKAENMSRIDAITQGIKGIAEVVKPMGAFISCDVYGAIISSSVDAKIVGQSYFNMGKYLDYICPMVYPSHYGDGYYGLDYPDCHPYELVFHALMDSQKVLYMLDPEENKAEVRPWLQDFTASWVRHHLNYGKEEVKDQINAVYDAGYSSWLLWNAGIKYTEDALIHE